MIKRLFNPSYRTSINQLFRKKRFAHFQHQLERLDPRRTKQILDIGGTEPYWECMGFPTDDKFHITLLNLESVKTRNAERFSSIKGDACDLSAFEDGSFDIVYSNSVIEHLSSFENQQKMATEVQRVGKNYYIQTPNYYFPLEPHWLFPMYQFLPTNLKVFLTQHFSMGHYRKTKEKAAAVRRVEEVRLLTEREMRRLFPHAEVFNETFLGMVKSITLFSFSGL